MASFVKILTAGGGNVTHMKLSQLKEVPEGTSHVLGRVDYFVNENREFS